MKTIVLALLLLGASVQAQDIVVTFGPWHGYTEEPYYYVHSGHRYYYPGHRARVRPHDRRYDRKYYREFNQNRRDY